MLRRRIFPRGPRISARGTGGASKPAIGATGFEPATFRPPAECATRLRHAPKGSARPLRSRYVGSSYAQRRHLAGQALKRATGIEPAMGAWKAPVLPTTPRPRRGDYRFGHGGSRLDLDRASD